MIGFDKKVYRVGREEGAEKGDPYGAIVPGRYGHLYIHGPALYGVALNGRRLVPRLAGLAEIVTDGDDGVNAVFPAAQLTAVGRLIRARRRRRLSPEHKAKLAASGRRFTARKSSLNAASDAPDATAGLATAV